ncbi:MAG: hypothetical protein ACP5N1_00355, partial [Candidatus Woesearchaeota archaeon]
MYNSDISISDVDSSMLPDKISISIDNYNYFVNEPISFKISGVPFDELSSMQLEITANQDPNFLLVFLGELDKDMIYVASNPGIYYLRLTSNDYPRKIYAESEFSVEESQGECHNISIIDNIFIDFKDYLSYSLKIPNTITVIYTDEYGVLQKQNYFSPVLNNITYSPSTTGIYTIYFDNNYLDCYRVFDNNYFISIYGADSIGINSILNESLYFDSGVLYDNNLSEENLSFLENNEYKKLLDERLNSLNVKNKNVGVENVVESIIVENVMKKISNFEGVSESNFDLTVDNTNDSYIEFDVILSDNYSYDVSKLTSYMQNFDTGTNISTGDISTRNISNGLYIRGLIDIDQLNTVKFIKNKNILHKNDNSNYNIDFLANRNNVLDIESEDNSEYYETFATDILYVNDINITNATVRLVKSGPVNVIVRCDEYDLDTNLCSDWEFTDISFSDYGAYIEFNVEHFSAYAALILITRADILDENRTILTNVYSNVSSLDEEGVTVFPNQYIRVTFEKPLNSYNDITLYARSFSSDARILVYEKNSEIILAEFTNINDWGYYKIFLTNLIFSQDTFDLKIVGADVDIDYIVDPTPRGILNITVLDTYTSSVNPYSVDGTTCMIRNIFTDLVYVTSVTDDTVTALNISDATNIQTSHYYNDNAPLGSVDGARGIKIDNVNGLAYVCSGVDDAVTILNISNSSIMVALGSTSNYSSNPYSMDGCYDLEYFDIGPTRFLAVAGTTDDTLTLFNVTDPSATPVPVSYRNTIANPCTTDDIRSLKYINVPGILIGSSYTDDTLSIWNITSNGSIDCVGQYSDSAGAGS